MAFCDVKSQEKHDRSDSWANAKNDSIHPMQGMRIFATQIRYRKAIFFRRLPLQALLHPPTTAQCVFTFKVAMPLVVFLVLLATCETVKQTNSSFQLTYPRSQARSVLHQNRFGHIWVETWRSAKLTHWISTIPRTGSLRKRHRFDNGSGMDIVTDMAPDLDLDIASKILSNQKSWDFETGPCQ